MRNYMCILDANIFLTDNQIRFDCCGRVIQYAHVLQHHNIIDIAYSDWARI